MDKFRKRDWTMCEEEATEAPRGHGAATPPAGTHRSGALHCEFVHNTMTLCGIHTFHYSGLKASWSLTLSPGGQARANSMCLANQRLPWDTEPVANGAKAKDGIGWIPPRQCLECLVAEGWPWLVSGSSDLELRHVLAVRFPWFSPTFLAGSLVFLSVW